MQQKYTHIDTDNAHTMYDSTIMLTGGTVLAV